MSTENAPSFKLALLLLGFLVVGVIVAFISRFHEVSLAQGSVQQEELSRRRSTRFGLDAVVFTRDAGATTSTAYHVAITSPQALPVANDSIFIADHVDSLQVTWREDGLSIAFPRGGRVFKKSHEVVKIGLRIPVSYSWGPSR